MTAVQRWPNEQAFNSLVDYFFVFASIFNDGMVTVFRWIQQLFLLFAGIK